MSDQLSLFEVPGSAKVPAPSELSAERRRTQRQARGIAWGIHPLTPALDGMLKIHPAAAAEGRTCGNCRFREVINLGTQRNYPKCTSDRPPCSPALGSLAGPRISRGAGTDIRKWWPGCRDHEFGDNALSPDAARSGPAAAYTDSHQ